MYYYISNGILLRSDSLHYYMKDITTKFIYYHVDDFGNLYFSVLFNEYEYCISKDNSCRFLELRDGEGLLLKISFMNKNMYNLCIEIKDAIDSRNGALAIELFEDAFLKMEKLSVFIRELYNQSLESAPELNPSCKSAMNVRI